MVDPAGQWTRRHGRDDCHDHHHREEGGRDQAALHKIDKLASDAGTSMTTVAVAWVLAHPAITAPIIGASRPEQLKDSLAAAETPLSPEIKAKVDELSHAWPAVDAER